ncbi:hypothetical protein A2767_01980 [Candidatus Roizmanbacteria bacterium RIFCSPHIGHO2_01_FULL_35_10]|nr:MAG: hypothetical protein A2767_01980 [Candidatus Roizmanbacteria bacterium RIFCSPHIGHO2_01_FULL_35_10]
MSSEALAKLDSKYFLTFSSLIALSTTSFSNNCPPLEAASFAEVATKAESAMWVAETDYKFFF